MSPSRTTLLAVFCVALVSAGTSVTAITLDSFTDPLPPNPDLPGSGRPILFVGTVFDPPSSYVGHFTFDAVSQAGLLGVIDGERYIELHYVAGTATVVVADGLSFNNDVGGRSTLDIQYGKTVDLDADLTVYAGTQIQITVLDGDMYAGPRPLPCTVTVTSRRGTPQEATASVTQDLVGNGLYAFPFASFVGVDFRDVDKIRVFLDASGFSAIDVLLGALETDGDPVATEPATWGKIKSLWE